MILIQNKIMITTIQIIIYNIILWYEKEKNNVMVVTSYSLEHGGSTRGPQNLVFWSPTSRRLILTCNEKRPKQ